MRVRWSVPAILLLAAASSARAQQPQISYSATEVAPGLYMLEGQGGFAGGNIGLLVGDEKVVLIDDGVAQLTETLRAAIAKITPRPIDFLINTHAHGDHIGGNEAFGKAGATIVAHDLLRERMSGMKIKTAEGERPLADDALPVVTFSDSVTFFLNGREAFVFHVEHAHTDGDAVIHFRKDNVIHAGDVFFNGVYPFIDLDLGGSVEGYITAQKQILALADDATKIIPGHGPLATKKDLQAASTMLQDAYMRVRKLVQAGRTKEQILAEKPLGDYDADWSWNFISSDAMTEMLVRALGAD